jgi:hypothetical protein
MYKNVMCGHDHGDKMDLILPSVEYKDSYIQYIIELGDEERYPFPVDFDYSGPPVSG